jgi:hypothetical protein
MLIILIFISKFSSGILALLISIGVISVILNYKEAIFQLILTTILFILLLFIDSFRMYCKEIISVLTDPVRAEHFGHSFREIFGRTSETIPLILIYGLILLIAITCITNHNFSKLAKKITIFVTMIFLTLFTIQRANTGQGFPQNFFWIQAIMISIYLSLVSLLYVSLRKKIHTDNNKFVTLSIAGIILTISQSIGSVNEPWAILSASAPTLTVLLYYSWKVFTTRFSTEHLSRILCTFLIVIAFLMSYFSGWKQPYRQSDLSTANIKLESGKLKNIYVNPETFNKIQMIRNVSNLAKTNGIEKMLALDSPILPLVQENYELQPIWLSQFWGITPDIVAEQCLAESTLNQKKTAMFIPNGIPDWPQLNDSITLCGLTVDGIVNNSLVVYKSKETVASNLVEGVCNAGNILSQENLGQGWWPSTTNQFWTTEGYVTFTLPPIRKNSTFVIDYEKISEKTKIDGVKFLLNSGKVKVFQNKILIFPNQADTMSTLEVKVINGARPINLTKTNEDVRLLGLNILGSRVQC